MFSSTAHIYDLVYEFVGKDYAGESQVVEDQIRSRTPQARTLLDVACGTGAHLAHLRQSFDIAGLDLDRAMLDQARRRLPDVDFIEANMRSFDVGRSFDAVVCLFSSVGYLPDRRALGEAIGCMARHLTAGGVLVVDGWIRPEDWKDPGTVHVVSGKLDDLAVARVGRSERHGNKTVIEFHHLVGTTATVEYLVDRHELTLFTQEDYVDAFTATELHLEVVEGASPERDRYIGVKQG